MAVFDVINFTQEIQKLEVICNATSLCYGSKQKINLGPILKNEL